MNRVTFNLKDDILKAVAESEQSNMKVTVKKLIRKLRRIDDAIDIVKKLLALMNEEKYIHEREPLCEVLDILNEYRDDILNSEVCM